jgi:two-component sensor histidine kinase
LTVADNGIGLPADLQVQNLPSVGMRVVFRLLNQLGATYQIDRTGGTTWRIQFRVPQ